jgi:type II secretory pathway pseudopilin PulG
MSRGFTLIEVVVAIIVLEVAVVGVLGAMVLSANIMREAEVVERATARAQGALDSLGAGGEPGRGVGVFDGGIVEWAVGEAGEVTVTSSNERDGAVVVLWSRVPLR